MTDNYEPYRIPPIGRAGLVVLLLVALGVGWAWLTDKSDDPCPSPPEGVEIPSAPRPGDTIVTPVMVVGVNDNQTVRIKAAPWAEAVCAFTAPELELEVGAPACTSYSEGLGIVAFPIDECDDTEDFAGSVVGESAAHTSTYRTGAGDLVITMPIEPDIRGWVSDDGHTGFLWIDHIDSDPEAMESVLDAMYNTGPGKDDGDALAPEPETLSGVDPEVLGEKDSDNNPNP